MRLKIERSHSFFFWKPVVKNMMKMTFLCVDMMSEIAAADETDLMCIIIYIAMKCVALHILIASKINEK